MHKIWTVYPFDPPPFGNLLIKEWQSLQAGNNLQNMSAKLFYL